nr:hypothetical protein CFP56_21067 [Quercus suber]
MMKEGYGGPATALGHGGGNKDADESQIRARRRQEKFFLRCCCCCCCCCCCSVQHPVHELSPSGHRVRQSSSRSLPIADRLHHDQDLQPRADLPLISLCLPLQQREMQSQVSDELGMDQLRMRRTWDRDSTLLDLRRPLHRLLSRPLEL